MCINPKSPFLTRADADERIAYWFKADCKLWSCEECAEKRKTRVAARAGRGAEYFAEIGYPVQFTTLTCHKKVRGLNASIERWRECWPRLRKRVNRVSPEFHYAVFPEKHKDGTMHVHLLETSGLPKRWFKDSCAQIGLGFVVDVQTCEHAGRAVAYSTKYITKSCHVETWPTSFHRFRFSRQWPDVDYLQTPSTDWKVFLSDTGFDDEMRHWLSLGFKIVNTRTGEINDGT
jgi:hypothetical protein